MDCNLALYNESNAEVIGDNKGLADKGLNVSIDWRVEAAISQCFMATRTSSL